MATKIAPNKSVKEAPAVDTKAADKEKLQAQRTKLIEAAAPAIAAKIGEQIEAKKTSENLFLEVADMLSETSEENGFSKEEARKVVLLALAEANDIEVEDINHKNPKALTLYTYASKVIVLAFPADKKAAAQLEKARDKGVGVESLLKVARGKVTAAEVNKSQGRGGDTTGKGDGKQKVNGKVVIEEIDAFKNEFAALVMRAIKGEIEIEALNDGIAETMAEIQETMSTTEE